jgi:RHS repeat-associated protein
MPATMSEFEHQDWLGTERARTSTSGPATQSFGSLPFGDGGPQRQVFVAGVEDDYTYNAPEGDWSPYHFAGYDQGRGPRRQVFVAGVEDNSANEHAQFRGPRRQVFVAGVEFREYSNMAGRWFSPDPYPGSYDPTNPQSFNRYAYVLNNPLSFTDPAGLGPGAGDCFLNGLSGNTCTVVVTGGPTQFGGAGGIGVGGLPLIFVGHNRGAGSGTAPNNPAPKTQLVCTATGLCMQMTDAQIQEMTGFPPTCDNLKHWAAGDLVVAAVASGGGKVWNPVAGAFAISSALEAGAHDLFCK